MTEHVQGPIVDLEFDGVIHVEAGKLVVGDELVEAAAIAGWGGSRQKGSVRITIWLSPTQNTVVNPLFGKFQEASEPPSGANPIQ